MSELREVFEMTVKQMGEPDLDSWREQERLQRNASRSRKLGAMAVAAVVLIAGVVVGVRTLGSHVSPVTPAGQATTPVPTNIGTVTITKAGCTLDGATNAPTGPFTVTVINRTHGSMDVDVFWVPNDQQFRRVLTYVEGTSAVESQFLYGNMPVEFEAQIQTLVDGRGSRTISGSLERGTYGIRCSDFPAAGFRPTDFVGPIQVR